MSHKTENDLNAQLLWSLRALAQDAETQFALYQCYGEAADDIVLDFESCVILENDDFLPKNEDIARLDAHLASKSGVVGYWSAHAMRYSGFWQEIRNLSKAILEVRRLPVTTPKPLDMTLINVDELHEETKFLKPLFKGPRSL